MIAFPTEVYPNSKCQGCFNYGCKAGRYGMCLLGLQPNICGEGESPLTGYSPVDKMGPEVSPELALSQPALQGPIPTYNEFDLKTVVLGEEYATLTKSLDKDSILMRKSFDPDAKPVDDQTLAKSLQEKLFPRDRILNTDQEVEHFVGFVRKSGHAWSIEEAARHFDNSGTYGEKALEAKYKLLRTMQLVKSDVMAAQKLLKSGIDCFHLCKSGGYHDKSVHFFERNCTALVKGLGLEDFFRPTLVKADPPEKAFFELTPDEHHIEANKHTRISVDAYQRGDRDTYEKHKNIADSHRAERAKKMAKEARQARKERGEVSKKKEPEVAPVVEDRPKPIDTNKHPFQSHLNRIKASTNQAELEDAAKYYQSQTGPLMQNASAIDLGRYQRGAQDIRDAIEAKQKELKEGPKEKPIIEYGPQGGKIIGRTKNNKPIYAMSDDFKLKHQQFTDNKNKLPQHRAAIRDQFEKEHGEGFSSQDHKEAEETQQQLANDAYNRSDLQGFQEHKALADLHREFVNRVKQTEPVEEGQEGIIGYDSNGYPVRIASRGDIPYRAAMEAHSGTSFSPEKRAEGEQQSYVNHMTSVWNQLEKRTKHPDYKIEEARKAKALEEFQNFKAQWRSRYMGVLGARSRLVSSMIAGPANFPFRRMAKKDDAYRNQSESFSEWERGAISRMMQAVRPDAPAVISSDSDTALTDLRNKIERLEQNQEKMKQVNKIVDKKGSTEEQKKEALLKLGYSEKVVHELLNPPYKYMGQGFESYMLSNNNANIRRLKEQLETVRSIKFSAPKEAKFDHPKFGTGKVEENKELGRFQIFFDSKPSEEARSELKSIGLHWSPSEGAWQRKNTPNAIWPIERLLGVKLAENTEGTTQEPPIEEEATEGFKLDETGLEGGEEEPVTEEQVQDEQEAKKEPIGHTDSKKEIYEPDAELSKIIMAHPDSTGFSILQDRGFKQAFDKYLEKHPDFTEQDALDAMDTFKNLAKYGEGAQGQKAERDAKVYRVMEKAFDKYSIQAKKNDKAKREGRVTGDEKTSSGKTIKGSPELLATIKRNLFSGGYIDPDKVDTIKEAAAKAVSLNDNFTVEDHLEAQENQEQLAKQATEKLQAKGWTKLGPEKKQEQRAQRFYHIAMAEAHKNAAKGEGSRGGKVVGHRKDGSPIYASEVTEQEEKVYSVPIIEEDMKNEEDIPEKAVSLYGMQDRLKYEGYKLQNGIYTKTNKIPKVDPKQKFEEYKALIGSMTSYASLERLLNNGFVAKQEHGFTDDQMKEASNFILEKVKELEANGQDKNEKMSEGLEADLKENELGEIQPKLDEFKSSPAKVGDKKLHLPGDMQPEIDQALEDENSLNRGSETRKKLVEEGVRNLGKKHEDYTPEEHEKAAKYHDIEAGKANIRANEYRGKKRFQEEHKKERGLIGLHMIAKQAHEVLGREKAHTISLKEEQKRQAERKGEDIELGRILLEEKKEEKPTTENIVHSILTGKKRNSEFHDNDEVQTLLSKVQKRVEGVPDHIREEAYNNTPVKEVSTKGKRLLEQLQKYGPLSTHVAEGTPGGTEYNRDLMEYRGTKDTLSYTRTSLADFEDVIPELKQKGWVKDTVQSQKEGWDKGVQLTAEGKEAMSQVKGNLAQLAMNPSKGDLSKWEEEGIKKEGLESRGGKVVGYDKNGDPIYESQVKEKKPRRKKGEEKPIHTLSTGRELFGHPESRELAIQAAKLMNPNKAFVDSIRGNINYQSPPEVKEALDKLGKKISEYPEQIKDFTPAEHKEAYEKLTDKGWRALNKKDKLNKQVEELELAGKKEEAQQKWEEATEQAALSQYYYHLGNRHNDEITKVQVAENQRKEKEEKDRKEALQKETEHRVGARFDAIPDGMSSNAAKPDRMLYGMIAQGRANSAVEEHANNIAKQNFDPAKGVQQKIYHMMERDASDRRRQEIRDKMSGLKEGEEKKKLRDELEGEKVVAAYHNHLVNGFSLAHQEYKRANPDPIKEEPIVEDQPEEKEVDPADHADLITMAKDFDELKRHVDEIPALYEKHKWRDSAVKDLRELAEEKYSELEAEESPKQRLARRGIRPQAEKRLQEILATTNRGGEYSFDYNEKEFDTSDPQGEHKHWQDLEDLRESGLITLEGDELDQLEGVAKPTSKANYWFAEKHGQQGFALGGTAGWAGEVPKPKEKPPTPISSSPEDKELADLHEEYFDENNPISHVIQIKRRERDIKDLEDGIKHGTAHLIADKLADDYDPNRTHLPNKKDVGPTTVLNHIKYEKKELEGELAWATKKREELQNKRTGEGSRGGEVIGHRKDGSPIYASEIKDKQPHELTPEEYETLLVENKKDTTKYERATPQEKERMIAKERAEAASDHKEMVELALSEGQAIPEKIRALYPDLMQGIEFTDQGKRIYARDNNDKPVTAENPRLGFFANLPTTRMSAKDVSRGLINPSEYAKRNQLPIDFYEKQGDGRYEISPKYTTDRFKKLYEKIDRDIAGNGGFWGDDAHETNKKLNLELAHIAHKARINRSDEGEKESKAKVESLQKDVKDLESKILNDYWAFTRQARAKPVSPELFEQLRAKKKELRIASGEKIGRSEFLNDTINEDAVELENAGQSGPTQESAQRFADRHDELFGGHPNSGMMDAYRVQLRSKIDHLRKERHRKEVLESRHPKQQGWTREQHQNNIEQGEKLLAQAGNLPEKKKRIQESVDASKEALKGLEPAKTVTLPSGKVLQAPPDKLKELYEKRKGIDRFKSDSERQKYYKVERDIKDVANAHAHSHSDFTKEDHQEAAKYYRSQMIGNNHEHVMANGSMAVAHDREYQGMLLAEPMPEVPGLDEAKKEPVEPKIEEPKEPIKEGEGSRGGKIVGHDKNGDPIYQSEVQGYTNPRIKDIEKHVPLTTEEKQEEVDKASLGKKPVVIPHLKAGMEWAEKKLNEFKGESIFDKLANLSNTASVKLEYNERQARSLKDKYFWLGVAKYSGRVLHNLYSDAGYFKPEEDEKTKAIKQRLDNDVDSIVAKIRASTNVKDRNEAYQSALNAQGDMRGDLTEDHKNKIRQAMREKAQETDAKVDEETYLRNTPTRDRASGVLGAGLNELERQGYEAVDRDQISDKEHNDLVGILPSSKVKQLEEKRISLRKRAEPLKAPEPIDINSISPEEVEKRIASVTPEQRGQFSSSTTVDWGNLRGQGKRIGGQVVGGMRDSSLQGEKTYHDLVGKLPENEREEFYNTLPEPMSSQSNGTNERLRYINARAIGINHDQALNYALGVKKEETPVERGSGYSDIRDLEEGTTIYDLEGKPHIFHSTEEGKFGGRRTAETTDETGERKNRSLADFAMRGNNVSHDIKDYKAEHKDRMKRVSEAKDLDTLYKISQEKGMHFDYMPELNQAIFDKEKQLKEKTETEEEKTNRLGNAIVEGFRKYRDPNNTYEQRDAHSKRIDSLVNELMEHQYKDSSPQEHAEHQSFHEVEARKHEKAIEKLPTPGKRNKEEINRQFDDHAALQMFHERLARAHRDRAQSYHEEEGKKREAAAKQEHTDRLDRIKAATTEEALDKIYQEPRNYLGGEFTEVNEAILKRKAELKTVTPVKRDNKIRTRIKELQTQGKNRDEIHQTLVKEDPLMTKRRVTKELEQIEKERKAEEKARIPTAPPTPKAPEEPTGEREPRWYKNSTGAFLNHNPLPLNTSETEEFEGTGISNLLVHHLWAELHDNKDASIEHYADRVLQPLWDEEASGEKYTQEKGAKVVRTMLQKLKKLGMVHQYPMGALHKSLFTPVFTKPEFYKRI